MVLPAPSPYSKSVSCSYKQKEFHMQKQKYAGVVQQGVRISTVLPNWSIVLLSCLTDDVLAWLSVRSELQIICIWTSWCYYHPVTSFVIKIHIDFAFPVPAYSGCPGKRPLNACPSSAVWHLYAWRQEMGIFPCFLRYGQSLSPKAFLQAACPHQCQTVLHCS